MIISGATALGLGNTQIQLSYKHAPSSDEILNEHFDLPISRPPSAIRLDTNKSVINLLPFGTFEMVLESDVGIELGKSAERALALSSAVGKRTIQPT